MELWRICVLLQGIVEQGEESRRVLSREVWSWGVLNIGVGSRGMWRWLSGAGDWGKGIFVRQKTVYQEE